KEAWATISGNKDVLKIKEVAYVPDDARIDIPALNFDVQVTKHFGYLKRDVKPEEVIDNTLLDEVLAGR
ncbi:MAG: hypothetical protein HY332_01705, partial [Chloroflexi bacterium]|nr:hypothetical protein [Chloroflexota bacterium]